MTRNWWIIRGKGGEKVNTVPTNKFSADHGDSCGEQGDSGADLGYFLADLGDLCAEQGNSRADRGDSSAEQVNSRADQDDTLNTCR